MRPDGGVMKMAAWMCQSAILPPGTDKYRRLYDITHCCHNLLKVPQWD